MGGVAGLTSIEYPDRRFQIWAYSASMGRLLLRSTKSNDFATRIDILFQNVKAIKLLASLDGLVISRLEAIEVDPIALETGLVESDETTIFSILAHGFDGYVIAGACIVSEDNGEYFDPSSLWPGRPSGM